MQTTDLWEVVLAISQPASPIMLLLFLRYCPESVQKHSLKKKIIKIEEEIDTQNPIRKPKNQTKHSNLHIFTMNTLHPSPLPLLEEILTVHPIPHSYRGPQPQTLDVRARARFLLHPQPPLFLDAARGHPPGGNYR